MSGRPSPSTSRSFRSAGTATKIATWAGRKNSSTSFTTTGYIGRLPVAENICRTRSGRTWNISDCSLERSSMRLELPAQPGQRAVGLDALLLADAGVRAVPQFERGHGQQESSHGSDHGAGQVQMAPPERRGRQYIK